MCYGGYDIFNVNRDVYEAVGRFTYYGYAAIGCQIHDSYCSWETAPLCLIFGGCGSSWNEEWSYDRYMTGYDINTLSHVGTHPYGCFGMPRLIGLNS
jgi:hypothetical protein